MSDDKPKLDAEGNPIVDPKDNGDDKPKDAGKDQSTLESLKADNAKKDEMIANLKGTQSAQSKSLDEMKVTVDSFTDQFKKAGIDPKDLNNLIATQSRSNLLIQVAGEKGLNASNIEFISGNTKEEIEASVDKFQNAIKEKVDAVTKKAEEEGKKKQEMPKNNNKNVQPSANSDVKSGAKAFLQNRGMIKKDDK